MTNPYDRLLTRDERLVVSLISKYPLAEVEDVIIEATKYQDEKTAQLVRNATIKECQDWLASCGFVVNISFGRDSLYFFEADDVSPHFFSPRMNDPNRFFPKRVE